MIPTIRWRWQKPIGCALYSNRSFGQTLDKLKYFYSNMHATFCSKRYFSIVFLKGGKRSGINSFIHSAKFFIFSATNLSHLLEFHLTSSISYILYMQHGHFSHAATVQMRCSSMLTCSHATSSLGWNLLIFYLCTEIAVAPYRLTNVVLPGTSLQNGIKGKQ